MTTCILAATRRALTFGLPVYVAVLAVYSVVPSATPATELIRLLPGFDLGAHFAAYGLLVLLVAGVCAGTRLGPLEQLVVAAGVALGVNALLEITQALLPWRTMAIRDFLAGAAGTVAAGALWLPLAFVLARRNDEIASDVPDPALGE